RPPISTLFPYTTLFRSLDSGEYRHPRLGYAQRVRQIDGVLHDVALGDEIRLDVETGIGDQQRPGVGRHVHHPDMAHAAVGAQPPDRKSTRLNSSHVKTS